MGCTKVSKPIPSTVPPAPPPPTTTTTHPDQIDQLLRALDSLPASSSSFPPPLVVPSTPSDPTTTPAHSSSTGGESSRHLKLLSSGLAAVAAVAAAGAARPINSNSTSSASSLLPKRRHRGSVTATSSSSLDTSERTQQAVIKSVLGTSPAASHRISTPQQIMDGLLKREEQASTLSSPSIGLLQHHSHSHPVPSSSSSTSNARTLRTWSSFLMPTAPASPTADGGGGGEGSGDFLTAREMLQMPMPPPPATAVHTKTVLQFLEAENEDDDDELFESGALQRFISALSPRDQTWTLASLKHFLYSDVNQARNQARLQQPHDWTRPLTEYFISTSHNTYLFGGQWVYYGGRVDISMYSRAIREGCRCVEIDLYDGDNGEPMVTHSNPAFAGGQCSFLDVCMLLADEAFSSSSSTVDRTMPLLLNLENNLKTNTRRAAEILLLAFGERLVASDDEEFGWQQRKRRFHASPQDLRGRVLCRSKTREAHADFQRLIYYRNAHLPAHPTQAQVPFYQTSSFSEGKAKRAFKKIDDLVQVNTQLLCRIYPRGSAVLSQNYNPLPFWLLGFQLVALNFQTDGLEMDLNHCLFGQTGNSGFVLKPYLFRRRRRRGRTAKNQRRSALPPQMTAVKEEEEEQQGGEGDSPLHLHQHHQQSFLRITEDGLRAGEEEEEEGGVDGRRDHPPHEHDDSCLCGRLPATAASQPALITDPSSSPLQRRKTEPVTSTTKREEGELAAALPPISAKNSRASSTGSGPVSKPPTPSSLFARSRSESNGGEVPGDAAASSSSSSFLKRVQSFTGATHVLHHSNSSNGGSMRASPAAATAAPTAGALMMPPPVARTGSSTAEESSDAASSHRTKPPHRAGGRNRRASAGAVMLEGMLAVISMTTSHAATTSSTPDENDQQNGEGEEGGDGSEDGEHDDSMNESAAAVEETTRLSYASLTVRSVCRVTGGTGKEQMDDREASQLTLELVVDGQHHLDRLESRVSCRAGETLTAVFKDSISALLTLRLLGGSLASTGAGNGSSAAEDSSTAAATHLLASRSFFAHCIPSSSSHHQQLHQLILVGETSASSAQQVYELRVECRTSVLAPLLLSPPPPIYCASELSMILCTVLSCRSELGGGQLHLGQHDPFVDVEVLGIPWDCRRTRTPPASQCSSTGSGRRTGGGGGDGREVTFAYPVVIPLAWSDLAFLRFSLMSSTGIGGSSSSSSGGGGASGLGVVVDAAGGPVRKVGAAAAAGTGIFTSARRLFGSNGGGGNSQPSPMAGAGAPQEPPTPTPLGSSLPPAANPAAAAAVVFDSDVLARDMLWCNAVRSGYRSVALRQDKTRVHVATLLCHFAIFNSKDDTFQRIPTTKHHAHESLSSSVL